MIWIAAGKCQNYKKQRKYSTLKNIFCNIRKEYRCLSICMHTLKKRMSSPTAVMISPIPTQLENFHIYYPNYHKMIFCSNNADLPNLIVNNRQIIKINLRRELLEYFFMILWKFPISLPYKIHIARPKIACFIMINLPIQLLEQIYSKLFRSISHPSSIKMRIGIPQSRKKDIQIKAE